MLSVESNRSETIVFENADINEGNSYNSTTGIFTAVHRGVYKFSMTIMAQMDSIVSLISLHIYEFIYVFFYHILIIYILT